MNMIFDKRVGCSGDYLFGKEARIVLITSYNYMFEG